MIRGWRNDPAWVEFYQRREQERSQRRLERLRMEMQIAVDNERAEAQLRTLRTLKPKDWEVIGY